ncbi:MAG: AAA family ATPase [Anaerolineae bacterium]|nr:AAA family ATPase [Anaerolineae bacterium]
MSTAFRFTMFGPPRLFVGDVPVSLPPQPAAFCAFLVLNRQRRILREEVQAAFWPDASPSRAQQRLRRTLYLLRQTLQSYPDLIATEGSEVSIAPDVDLWVDYEAFETALMEAYRHDPPDCRGLVNAVTLYQDDLLKDIYADWALLEREHARERLLTALRNVMLACQRDGHWQDAIRYARLLLEYDPFQEIAYRALMTAYAAAGDRSAALRQYQQCVQVLNDELETDPLPETTRLYDDIRQGRGVTPVEIQLPVAISAPIAPDLDTLPLVGRDQELAGIAAEWRGCQQGSSRLLLITGPAGMGKTRLVQEAVRYLPGPDVNVITGNCYAMEAGTPFQLIADLMRKAVDMDIAPIDPDARAELSRLVPALRGPDSVPAAPDVSVRLQEAVTHVIRQFAASGAGLWLVTEDLHWADPASLACLNHALRRCHDLPLLALATLRDEEVSYDSPLMDWPTNLVHAPAPATLIRLSPLPPEQLEYLLAQLVGSDVMGNVESSISHIVPLLYRETAGNPLFVIETLRAMIEQGGLVIQPDGRWQLRADTFSQVVDLPLSEVVLRVIRGRIRRLSRAAQEVLTAAAVIEHDIDEKLLVALVDPAIAWDLALDEVLRAAILAETAPGLYQFTHIKVREIIYADTSAPRRRFLHRRVAEVLAQQPGMERANHLAGVSRLAYHFAQAREWTRALLHGWQAAQTAWTAGAMAEANRYAEGAQGILDEYSAALEPDLLPESLPAIRFDLLVLRAEFRRRAATAGLYYPADLIETVETLLPDVDESRQARASLQQATHRLGQGDLAGAKEAAARGRALYARLDDVWGELDATQHQIDIAFRAGDMVLLRHLLDDMRRLSAPIDRQQQVAYNEMRQAVYQGRWGEVLRFAQEAVPSEDRPVDPAVAWLSLAHLGTAYLKLGAYAQAQQVAEQAVAASEDAHVLGLGARVLLAKVHLQRGYVHAAREMLLGLLEVPDPLIGEGEVVSPALALVRCCVAVGDTDGADRWARRAAQAVSRVRLPVLYPLSQVGWALAHLAAERYEKAQKRLSYPVEYMLLLPDTAPQEVFALRAAAAHGLGDDAAAQRWLARARSEVSQQAAMIAAPFSRSFLEQVLLHRWITEIGAGASWQPGDLLALPVSADENMI